MPSHLSLSTCIIIYSPVSCLNYILGDLRLDHAYLIISLIDKWYINLHSSSSTIVHRQTTPPRAEYNMWLMFNTCSKAEWPSVYVQKPSIKSAFCSVHTHAAAAAAPSHMAAAPSSLKGRIHMHVNMWYIMIIGSNDEYWIQPMKLFISLRGLYDINGSWKSSYTPVLCINNNAHTRICLGLPAVLLAERPDVFCTNANTILLPCPPWRARRYNMIMYRAL